MSDLLHKSIEQALDELEKQNANIALKEAKVDALDAELAEERANLEVERKQFEKEQKELEPVKKALEEGMMLDSKEKELLLNQTKLNAKQLELSKWENRLVAIEQIHDRRQSELEAREKAVSEREETYKVKLRKEFLEDLEKKLGRH